MSYLGETATSSNDTARYHPVSSLAFIAKADKFVSRSLFDKLTEAVKATPKNESNTHATYSNNDKIRFWTHDSFNKYVSSAEGLGKKEGPSSVTFLEDVNGETLSKDVIKTLRKDLKSAFRELALKGIASKSWGKASMSAKKIVKDHMEANWAILRLAENGWKLEHLASLDYPGWMRTNLNEHGKLLSNPGSEGDSETSTSRKRKGKDKSEEPDKKPKSTFSTLEEQLLIFFKSITQTLMAIRLQVRCCLM